MTDGKWTDTVIDALQSAESAQRRAKELEAERDSLRVYVERLETALTFIASHAGQTLISVEHGQPYSIGANAAFEQLAATAIEALTPTPENPNG